MDNKTEKIQAEIKKGIIDLVSEEDLLKKFSSQRKLRIKLGVDPTSPDLHLGHMVVLSKLRAFQDLGHTGVLIIGDFTAGIGDPSGRDATRPVLNAESIKKNTQTYKEQAFSILDPLKTEIRFNSEWLFPFVESKDGAMPAMFSALSRITLSRLLEREDFKSRLKEGNPITLLELIYPILQGYDSVAVNADVELGGADQIFNLLMGRDVQKDYGQEPQVVITVPLLVGTDGVRKMSKSYGNYIAFRDSARDMFGKIMSLPDEVMLKYYELLTCEEAGSVKAMHPMDAKKRLAWILVSRFHCDSSAETEKNHFENVFCKKQIPDDMPVFRMEKDTRLSYILVSAGLVPSMNEARRLIRQEAVRLDGVKITEDKPIAVSKDTVLQVGRRIFCKLVYAGKTAGQL